MGSHWKDRQLSAAELIGDPIISAVERLVSAQSDGVWCGNLHEALSELSARTPDSVRRDPVFWPKNGQGLSRRLGRMGEGFRAAGIVVNHRRGGICFARAAEKSAA